jgi:hypothetical protein
VTGTYAYTCSCATTGFSDSNPYANGQRVTSSTSGSTWTADTTVGGRDLNFITYINPGFAASGTFESSVKDANPATGLTPTWTTFTFSATTPANTAVKFQVAASNSPAGPFNYVGPDGTAGTFFTTSGASLTQFNGRRYLRYKAYLSTTDTSVTPSVSSVTVCFQNGTPTSVATSAFAARRTARAVVVTWRTQSEVQIAGFKVFRNGVRLNRALIAAKHAGQSSGAAYRLVDRGAARGRRYVYRLHVVAPTGKESAVLAAASSG